MTASHSFSPDIVQRLRDESYKGQEGMRVEAADEIDRLRASLPTATGGEMQQEPGAGLKDFWHRTALALQEEVKYLRGEAGKWPKPKVTNPDIANPTGVPYIDCLIHRVLDAQQDINLTANEGMSQSLCDAAALMDEVETALRTAAICAPDAAATPADYVLVPRELTAENGAKSALIGEFSETFDYMDEEGDECQAEIPVSWTTIKQIHKKMVALFSRPIHDPAQRPPYPAEEYAKVALGNAVEVGRLEILVARMERAVKAANAYFGCYVQDEAEEIECCISPEQHEAAKELRDALRIAVSALSSTDLATPEIDDGSYTDDPRLAVPMTSPNREASK